MKRLVLAITECGIIPAKRLSARLSGPRRTPRSRTIDPRASREIAALLARCGVGDRDAFARLYRLTSPNLFGLALRILGRRSLAEEALQDAFVNIWRHAADFRPERAAPQTWLAAIVRNRALDLLRASPPEDPPAEDPEIEAWASADLGPLEKAMAGDEAKALLECMKRLQAKQRQAIALAYYHGLAHGDLARHLAEPIGTVKTWIRRGIEQLKRCLEA